MMRTLALLAALVALPACGLFTDCDVKEATGTLKPLDTARCQALFEWASGDLDLHPRDFVAWEANQIVVHLGTHLHVGQQATGSVTFTGDVYSAELGMNVAESLLVGYADFEVLEATPETLKVRLAPMHARMPRVMAGDRQLNEEGPGTFVGEVTAMAR